MDRETQQTGASVELVDQNDSESSVDDDFVQTWLSEVNSSCPVPETATTKDVSKQEEVKEVLDEKAEEEELTTAISEMTTSDSPTNDATSTPSTPEKMKSDGDKGKDLVETPSKEETPTPATNTSDSTRRDDSTSSSMEVKDYLANLFSTKDVDEKPKTDEITSPRTDEITSRDVQSTSPSVKELDLDEKPRPDELNASATEPTPPTYDSDASSDSKGATSNKVPCEDSPKDVDIVLIGKTGNGKSATANTILGKRAFKSMSSTQSVTLHVETDYCEFRDRIIKVVDGPGVGDTRMNDEKSKKLLQKKFSDAVLNNPDGFHAFIIVVRFGGRFTNEDKQTIGNLKQIFGLDFVANYCVLVMTNGDGFDDDQEETGLSFNAWCRAQSGVFSDLLKECNGRIVLFDNKTKDQAVREAQITKLLSVIDSLGGRRYTNELFDAAKHLREKQMLEAKEPQIQEKTMKEISILSQKLRELEEKDIKDKKRDLKQLKFRAEVLLEDVEKQDKGTNVLKGAIQVARSFLEEITTQRQLCSEILQARKVAKEQQEKMMKENEEKRRQEAEAYAKRVEAEREALEKRRQEEQKEMYERFQKQNDEAEKRHKEAMEAMREEMKNSSETERHMREMEMERQEERRQQADMERARREKEEYDRRIEAEKKRLEAEQKKQADMLNKFNEEKKQISARYDAILEKFENEKRERLADMEQQRKRREEAERKLREEEEAKKKKKCVIQ